MELTALAIFLTCNPQSFQPLLDFSTIDGDTIPHAEGQAALLQGRAVLVGGLLVGALDSQPYSSLYAAA